MKPGSVHVVILNWRSADMALRSAETALHAMEGVEGLITLVDNDSGDGSFETLLSAAEARGWTESGRVRVLQAGRNGGFGAGNNFGLKQPGGPDVDHVLILNPDAFPDPSMIRLMRDYMDARPDVGLLGSRVEGTDGRHHETHFRFPSVASEFENAAQTGPISRILSRSIVAMPMPQQAGAVDWVAGASLMIRASVLERIGGFDEAFFLYFEETDLCRRAAEAGWPTHYMPEARVAHIGSATTGMKEWKIPPDYWFQSREHYFRHNHGRAYAMMATVAHLAGLGVRRLRMAIGRDDPTFPKGQAAALIRHAFAPGRPRQINRSEYRRDPA